MLHAWRSGLVVERMRNGRPIAAPTKRMITSVGSAAVIGFQFALGVIGVGQIRARATSAASETPRIAMMIAACDFAGVLVATK